MTSQESRYRRLLALYPRDHRREYEEEMITVLLADGRSGPGTALNLVGAALAARSRQVLRAATDELWSAAARLVWVFGAALLLGVALRRLVPVAVYALSHPGAEIDHVAPVDPVRAVLWALVLTAALAGWRTAGAVLAAAGLAAEIVAPAQQYLDTPARLLEAYWIILAAVVVLVSSTLARGRGVPRGSGWVAAGVLVLIPYSPFLRGGGEPGTVKIALVLPALAILLVGVAVARQQPAIGRRLLACAVPVVAVLPLVRVGFAGFVEHNMGHPEALALLSPVQWAALVVVPLVAFAVAVELNRRLEAGGGRTVSVGRTPEM